MENTAVRKMNCNYYNMVSLPNIIMLKEEARYEKIYIWFHMYEVQKEFKVIIDVRSQKNGCSL